MSRDGLRVIFAGCLAIAGLHDGPPRDTLSASKPVTKALAFLFLSGRRRRATPQSGRSPGYQISAIPFWYGAFPQELFSAQDRTRLTGCRDVGRYRQRSIEEDIPLDTKAERQAQRLQFSQ